MHPWYKPLLLYLRYTMESYRNQELIVLCSSLDAKKHARKIVTKQKNFNTSIPSKKSSKKMKKEKLFAVVSLS